MVIRAVSIMSTKVFRRSRCSFDHSNFVAKHDLRACAFPAAIACGADQECTGRVDVEGGYDAGPVAWYD